MVVSEQMQYPMNKENRQLAVQTVSHFFGLPGGRFHGDYHIPEELGLDVRPFPFPHREREYIGRLVDPPVAFVQPSHVSITYE